MTVLAIKPPVLAVCATLLLAHAAQAQDVAAPPPLATGAPMVILSPNAEQPQIAPAAPQDAKVQVQDLTAPPPGAIGTLEPAQGGFAPDLWRGSSLAAARRLMPLLPVAAGSPVLRDLSRRVLLSAAGFADAATAEPGRTALELRAERLWAMGETAALAGLLRAAPQSAVTPALTRLHLDAALLSGDGKAACDILPAALAADTDGRLAQEQVLCHFLSGRTLEGTFALDLLRERKGADPAFIAAAEALAGLPPNKKLKLDATPLTPVSLAAFRAAKLPLSAEMLPADGAALLAALAQDTSQTPELRLAATERALAHGSLSAESLRAIYEELTFPPAELAAPPGSAATLREKARLYHLARSRPADASRAELIARALDQAAKDGRLAVTARLYLRLLADIAPGPGTAGFAPQAIRVLGASPQHAAAIRWAAALASPPEPARTPPGSWLILRLGDTAELKPPAAPEMAAWVAAAPADMPTEAKRRRAALGLGLLQSLGEQVPAPLWSAVLADAPAAASPAKPRLPGLGAMLNAAIAEKRVGETILLALAGLSGEPLERADPDAIFDAVRALAQVGLADDARALAMEAALVNGG